MVVEHNQEEVVVEHNQEEMVVEHNQEEMVVEHNQEEMVVVEVVYMRKSVENRNKPITTKLSIKES